MEGICRKDVSSPFLFFRFVLCGKKFWSNEKSGIGRTEKVFCEKKTLIIRTLSFIFFVSLHTLYIETDKNERT